MGVEFRLKSLILDEKHRLDLKIWDTCGEEKFRAITRQYYRDVNGVLLVFDLTNSLSFEQLKNIAQGCLAMAPYDTKVATYSVINQKKLLGISGMAEQLALFILLVDSELDMLRIYEEESMMSEVERRIKEQFGYYNPELLNLDYRYRMMDAHAEMLSFNKE
jgi:GTPase SAR1 family protein